VEVTPREIPFLMTPGVVALLALAILAVLFEVAGLLACGLRKRPLGPVFGSVVFIQTAIPAGLLYCPFVLERIEPSIGGVEPFSGHIPAFHLWVYAALVVVGAVSTLLAGGLGFRQLFSRGNC
jgi:hypothetical protein